MNIHTNLPKYIVVGIWFVINVALFLNAYLKFANAKKYFYLHYILKGRF